MKPRGWWLPWVTGLSGLGCAIGAFWNPLLAFGALMFGFQFGWSVTELDHIKRKARKTLTQRQNELVLDGVDAAEALKQARKEGYE